MTEPGFVAPASPGWWVRTNRVGTNANTYGFDFTATGGRPSIGIGAMSYGWALTGAGYVPIAFDAVGPGGTPLSWSHTGSSAARLAVVMVTAAVSSTTLAGSTRTATYNGSAMTSLAVVQYYDDTVTRAWIEIFGILAPASGTKTAAWSCSPAASTFVGNTTSYTGVSSFSAGSTNTATGTSMSHSVASAAGRRIVQGFAASGTPALSAYNQTQRYLRSPGDSAGNAMAIGDAAGASSVNFTGTLSTSVQWGSAAVSLILP